MAVGTVSALEPNQWQLISSAAATSQTEVTFSSLTGYKQYRIVYYRTGVSNDIWLRFNGDTGTNYFSNSTRGSSNGSISTTYLQINTVNTSTAVSYQGYIDVFNADKPIEKTAEGHGGYYMGNVYGGWSNAAVITSITFGSTASMSEGTVKLYGIAS